MKKANETTISKKIAFTSLFAALCAISTLFLALPLPSFGYVNVGDVFVLLAGWCLGPLYGGIAAAVGSSLADIIGGFAIYAPVTFVIKWGVAFLAYYVYIFFKSWIKKVDIFPLIISAVVAEVFMAIGYFCYELLLYGAGAVASLPWNFLQAGVCTVLGSILIFILKKVKAFEKIFPLLSSKK